MFRSSSRINTLGSQNFEAYIIYYISTDEYEEFTNLINNSNINKIINKKNGYTALHYAIFYGRDKMIKFLLDNNVSLDIKTANGEDLYQFSVQNNNMCLINYRNEKDKNTINELQKNNNILNRKINTIESNNKFLTKSNEDYLNKYNQEKLENSKLEKDIQKVNSENIDLKNENKSLKRKNDNMEKVNSENIDLKNENKSLIRKNDNMEKDLQKVNSENIDLKRKNDNLEKSFDGLLSNIKK